eukprot:TRINITY_DN5443_c0_g1_i4.p1 TRINITY_DN5443_c0_g1~~TRINITY_DN5443_c0_g1_i4.p1  ORF type:complete len:123 (+),score=19.75 TRINITY_DN5443_c0_g1_i4:32-370(+)
MGDDRPIMAVLESFYEKDSEKYFAARWFLRPEDTHGGRLVEHGRREVFECSRRSHHRVADINRLCEIWYPAKNLSIDDAEARTQGRDRFYCRMFYNIETKSFQQLDSNRRKT